jgi:hypothetical protein
LEIDPKTPPFHAIDAEQSLFAREHAALQNRHWRAWQIEPTVAEI